MTTQLKGWRRGCDIPADERVGWWQYTVSPELAYRASTEDLPRISFYVVHVSQCRFCSNIWYRPVQFNDEIEPPPIQPLELPDGLRYVGERWKFLWSSLALWCMSDDFPATTVHGNLCSCSDTPHCLVCHVFDMPPAPDNPLDHIYHRQPDGSWKRWEGQ